MKSQSQSTSPYYMPYSAELQGLRAIAVISVLIYHIDALLLPGGYLGVDIFFVLSGYLIGRKLLAELDNTGQIDLIGFTSARIKRLLPNALTVLIFTGFASYIFLPPYRLTDVAEDIWAAAFIHANVHFADRAIDYMQIGEHASPVLHFWSLSVEEQFYVLFPLLLMTTALVRKNLRLSFALSIITIVMIVSFFSGLLDLRRSQPDAFFLMQNRIWQLCCGVLCGAISAKLKPRSLNALIVLQLSAIAVVAGSLLFLSSTFAYPGALALVPTLAASALIISVAAQREGILNKTLSTPFCQWVGDRSYSIYLWHWPMIAIASEAYPDSRTVVWIAGIGSILPAAIIFELLEKPLRKVEPRAKLQLVSMGIAGAAATAIASIGLAFIPQSEKTSARAAKIEAARVDFGGSSETNCHLDMETVASPPCTFGTDENGRIMLIGDSHAAQWFDPIRAAATEEGWQFISRTKTSCPSLDVQIWYPPKAAVYKECQEWRASVMKEIATLSPDVIILANYSGYDGWIAENGQPVSRPRAQHLWEAALTLQLERLAPKSEVWVMRDTPKMHPNYLACLSYSDDCHRSRTIALDRFTDDAQIAAQLGRAVNVVDLTSHFCDEKRCSAAVNGQIVYRDHHHITSTFSTRFTNEFRAILKGFTGAHAIPENT